MQTFKTKAGTELPLGDVKGKPYLHVQWRLVWFREEHKDWSIETEIKPGQGYCLSKAIIKDASGKLMATAHKFEDQKGFADYIEKSETGAIGRALAMCGYGTQFAVELEEDDRIVDSPVTKTAAQPAPKPNGYKPVKSMSKGNPAEWENFK